MKKNILILSFALLSFLNLSGCSTTHNIDLSFLNSPAPMPRENSPAAQLDNNQFWQGDADSIWIKLQRTAYPKLLAGENTTDANAAAWTQLAIISKRDSSDTNKLVHDLIDWRNRNPSHPGNQLFADDATLNNLLSQAVPKHIAVLLPLQGEYAPLGNAVRNGFLNAYYLRLGSTSQQQVITFYDTNLKPDIAALYQQAIAEGAEMVIGPLTKDNVQKLTAIGSFVRPTIALNYTDLWFGALPNNLYQFGLSPIDEAKQIADKAWQSGRTRALILAPQDECGQRVSKAVIARWQANGGSVTDTYYFSSTADLSKDIPQLLRINVKADQDKMRDTTENNKTSLEKQRRQDFDVVFLLATPEKARSIIPLLRYYYVTDIPIYATSATYSGTSQPLKDTDLNNVFFCDIPAVLNGSGTNSNARLYAVGQDAYLISHELPRFLTLPNFPAYAATGALTLDPKHQFYRRLAWAQFHDGHP